MEIRARQPNPLLKMLSDALRSTQEFGNKAEIPYLGGVGDLLLGDAQDTAEKLSYGEKPWQGSGQTLQLDPGTADLAGLATIPAAMAKSGATGVAKSLRNAAGKGKREFIEGVGEQAGVRPHRMQLANQLDHEEVLSRGMIESPNRELFGKRSPRPVREEAFSPTPFQHLTEEGKRAVTKARQDVPLKGSPAKPVANLPNPSRRKFLKDTAIAGAGAAGIATLGTAPKLLSKALRNAPDAAGSVSKAVGAPVAKAATKAFTQANMDSATERVISAYLEGVVVKNKGKVIKDVMKKMSPESKVEFETSINKMVSKYGDDFEPEGFADRMAMAHPDADFKNSNLAQMPETDWGNPDYWKAPEYKAFRAKQEKAMDWFDKQPNQDGIIERWRVTGKWPEGKNELMKYFDPQTYVEHNIDTMSGALPSEQRLFDESYDVVMKDHKDSMDTYYKDSPLGQNMKRWD